MKDGVTFEIMENVAYAITDNEPAVKLQKAQQQLFKNIDEQDLKIHFSIGQYCYLKLVY